MSESSVFEDASLDTLHHAVVQQFASLMREHVYADLFRENSIELFSVLTTEMTGIFSDKTEADTPNFQKKLLNYLDRLRDSLQSLNQQQINKSHNDKSELKNIIPRFNTVITKLKITQQLILKQVKILEYIISLHEYSTKWDSVIQKIATYLNELFPFQFLSIIYSENHGVYLNIYYGTLYTTKQKQQIQQHVIQKALLILPHDKNVFSEIRELDAFSETKILSGANQSVSCNESCLIEKKYIHLLNVFGALYLPAQSITSQEKKVIDSVLNIVCMTTNFGKTLDQYVKELNYYAAHDPLTGIHNRRYFNEILTYEIASAERYHREFAVLMIDLDNFKLINDTYGHFCGDMVLKCIANAMTTIIRSSDIVARIGGDEFALVLKETTIENAKKTAEVLRKKINELSFLEANNHQFSVSVSVGVIHYPSDAKTLSDLMAGVDIALYEAKHTGKNVVYLFDAHKDKLKTVREIRSNVDMLRMALNEGRIKPFFQPIMNCKTRNIVAHEVLARLHALDGTIKTASEFIELIERHGLSQLFNEAIIENSLMLYHDYQASKSNTLLFMNLSTQAIHNHHLLTYAEYFCKKLNISPSQIVFEILERDAIIDISEMKKNISYMENLGFNFALDDFGTGYNSFYYLQKLPFKYIKLDGSFVKGVLTSKVNYSLVKNIVLLCKDLNIKTVAEFIETEEILNVITELGVDYAQGYYIGMPESNFTL